MAKILRKPAKIFGSTATAGTVAKFGSLAAGSPAFSSDPTVIQSLGNWLQGWYGAVVGATSPAIEDMNAFCYVMAYQVAYQLQQGVPEWDSATPYYIGSVVNDAGSLYVSTQDNHTNHAVTEVSYWKRLDSSVIKLAVSNWATRTTGLSSQADVTYGNGLFVAVGQSGSDRVTTSANGIQWTIATASQLNPWASVAYGAGVFVAVATSGTNQVMSSPNGTTWTNRSAAAANQWTSVCYGGGQFVAVARSGTDRVMTSPDGITWTSRTAAQANTWRNVCYGNGLFVAVSSDGTNRVMTSPDGITWTARNASASNQWNAVTYGGGLFVATSYDGTDRIMSSPDGFSWTARTAPEQNQWGSIVYGHGIFVSCSVTSAVNPIMYSVDGITWKGVANVPYPLFVDMAVGPNCFFALSNTDGATSLVF